MIRGATRGVLFPGVCPPTDRETAEGGGSDIERGCMAHIGSRGTP